MRSYHRYSFTRSIPHNWPAELKKDPGVPRLPNLRVRGEEKQRRRSVCPYLPRPLIISLTVRPYSSLPHTLRCMKMRRWPPSPRSLHSPSSRRPHRLTTSCHRHPSQRLQRRRSSCGGTTSACCIKLSTRPTLSFSCSTHVTPLGVAADWWKRRCAGAKWRVNASYLYSTKLVCA